MFFFEPHSKIRRFCFALANSSKFDNFLIICIIASSSLLAVETPLTDPKSDLNSAMNYLDLIFTCIFLCEIVIKVITMGFILSKNSYLRNPWNILDFSIVIGACISSFGLTNQNINIIKTFRLTRILRPLRLISRNEGLKITINSLIKAIPNILNLVMLNSFFFLLYGILGTNFFKGLHEVFIIIMKFV